MLPTSTCGQRAKKERWHSLNSAIDTPTQPPSAHQLNRSGSGMIEHLRNSPTDDHTPIGCHQRECVALGLRPAPCRATAQNALSACVDRHWYSPKQHPVPAQFNLGQSVGSHLPVCV